MTDFQVVKQFSDRPVDAAEPQNIIISFDGTGGEPEWAVQEDREVPLYANVGGLSNVCKLHLHAGGTIDNSSCSFPNQIPLYYKGVGTWEDLNSVSLFKQAVGAGEMTNIYLKAYEDLKKIHREGDKIFVYGFSRGAATARLFASYLSKNKINDVEPVIAFLGVWDTVAQSSDVGTSEDAKNLDVDGEDSALPKCVQKAFHLVSIDESREPFRPTLFDADDDRVTEIWCPGNHSDIGGGYYHDGLSDITLMTMKIESGACGLKFREFTEDFFQDEAKRATITGATEVKNVAEFDKDLHIKPNALDADIHDQMSAMYIVINFFKRFSRRKILCKKGDAVWEGKEVLLMDSAIKRIEDWDVEDVPKNWEHSPYWKSSVKKTRYFPENLVGVPYRVVKVDTEAETITILDEVHPGMGKPKTTSRGILDVEDWNPCANVCA